MVIQADSEGLTTKAMAIRFQRKSWFGLRVSKHQISERYWWSETNRINQLVVKNTLQNHAWWQHLCYWRLSTMYTSGWFICSEFLVHKRLTKWQAAHSATSLLKLNGRDLKDYVYKDKGSLVSLSRFSTVGSLMGNPFKGSRWSKVVLLFAWFSISLYRMHQVALHGIIIKNVVNDVGRPNQPCVASKSEAALINWWFSVNKKSSSELFLIVSMTCCFCWLNN